MENRGTTDVVRIRPSLEWALRTAASTSGINPDEVLTHYRACRESMDSAAAKKATAEHFGIEIGIEKATEDMLALQLRFYANYPAALEFSEPHRITEETEP